MTEEEKYYELLALVKCMMYGWEHEVRFTAGDIVGDLYDEFHDKNHEEKIKELKQYLFDKRRNVAFSCFTEQQFYEKEKQKQEEQRIKKVENPQHNDKCNDSSVISRRSRFENEPEQKTKYYAGCTAYQKRRRVSNPEIEINRNVLRRLKYAIENTNWTAALKCAKEYFVLCHHL